MPPGSTRKNIARAKSEAPRSSRPRASAGQVRVRPKSAGKLPKRRWKPASTTTPSHKQTRSKQVCAAMASNATELRPRTIYAFCLMDEESTGLLDATKVSAIISRHSAAARAMGRWATRLIPVDALLAMMDRFAQRHGLLAAHSLLEHLERSVTVSVDPKRIARSQQAGVHPAIRSLTPRSLEVLPSEAPSLPTVTPEQQAFFDQEAAFRVSYTGRPVEQEKRGPVRPSDRKIRSTPEHTEKRENVQPFPAELGERVLQVFWALDRDGSGKIPKRELIGLADRGHTLQTLGTDESGNVSVSNFVGFFGALLANDGEGVVIRTLLMMEAQSEYISAVEQLQSYTPGREIRSDDKSAVLFSFPVEMRARVMQVFWSLTLDDTGRASGSQLQSLESLGSMFGAMELDRDGQVGIEEFVAFFGEVIQQQGSEWTAQTLSRLEAEVALVTSQPGKADLGFSPNSWARASS
eukprot:TRINITY_DN38269_c0_g1_i1.p1 TRINITY_DN38269_c0_g1~~TRINITY_DN38269_c0_g1_i1.p1  ORF type:complete len:465 (-),score=72.12 TRINITY_DN38269_c0_g1_i1:154-1548(-)